MNNLRICSNIFTLNRRRRIQSSGPATLAVSPPVRREAYRLRRIGHPMQFERTKPFVLYPVLPDAVRASVKNWLSRALVKLWVSETAEAKA